MNAREQNGVRMLDWTEPITRVDDALSLVTACIERGARGVLIEAHHLPAALFDLRTGFAGEFLQKLQNYRIRVGAVFPSEEEYGTRFREFLSEAKRGRDFRAFTTRADATAWLMSD
jgi:hypothetical protein